MVLLDTNIFVIDRFFKRDERYADNKLFINALANLDAGFSIFSLLELCGISSFNLSAAELKRWMFHFSDVYHISILEPRGIKKMRASEWFDQYTADAFQLLTRKATWGDAMVLYTAEQHEVETIISWNQKHFVERTTIPVLSPKEFLRSM